MRRIQEKVDDLAGPAAIHRYFESLGVRNAVQVAAIIRLGSFELCVSTGAGGDGCSRWTGG